MIAKGITVNLTCIVPARNEQGHISDLIGEILTIKQINEVIIVEGGSTDDTYNEAIRVAAKDSLKIKVMKQLGTGKFNAVIQGASVAKNDVIIIWDADGTVPTESTQGLIERHALSKNFTMGNRLFGSIEKGAMQRFNYLGNWLFALLWVPITGRRPTDMLCGTKIFKKSTLNNIPNWLLKYDPYGDFALVATTRSNGEKIDAFPVNYIKRTYGQTNINRWSGGLKLLLVTILVYVWLGRVKLIRNLIRDDETF